MQSLERKPVSLGWLPGVPQKRVTTLVDKPAKIIIFHLKGNIVRGRCYLNMHLCCNCPELDLDYVFIFDIMKPVAKLSIL